MRMIPVSWNSCLTSSSQRKPGYLEALKKFKKTDEDVFLMSEEDYHGIANLYRFPVIKKSSENINPVFVKEIDSPSILDLASNFTKATSKWVSAGFPVVSKEIYEKRASVCSICEHWNGHSRLGLGMCNHNSCGCTSFKRWLETEKCPIGKWIDS